MSDLNLPPTIGVRPGANWTGLVVVVGCPVDASVVARGDRSKEEFARAVLARLLELDERHCERARLAWARWGKLPGALPWRVAVTRPGKGAKRAASRAARVQADLLRGALLGARMVDPQPDREQGVPTELRGPWREDWSRHDAVDIGGQLDKRAVRGAWRAAVKAWEGEL